MVVGYVAAMTTEQRMFTPITGEKLESFRKQSDCPDIEMAAYKLPFYGHGQLIKIKHEGQFYYFAVVGEDLETADWNNLDGSVTSIHVANKMCGLKLTEDNILEYLRFFCSALKMESGCPMKISENGHVEFANGKRVATASPVFKGMSKGNGFLCQAHVLYQGTVLEAGFEVSPDGNTKMLWDEPMQIVEVH
jgi:hypothetical protein